MKTRPDGEFQTDATHLVPPIGTVNAARRVPVLGDTRVPDSEAPDRDHVPGICCVAPFVAVGGYSPWN